MPRMRRKAEAEGAEDDEEIEEGLVCVAAPIRDHTTHVVAAVSIAGPSSRIRSDAFAERIAEVVETACAMSEALGCPPDVARPAAPERSAARSTD